MALTTTTVNRGQWLTIARYGLIAACIGFAAAALALAISAFANDGPVRWQSLVGAALVVAMAATGALAYRHINQTGTLAGLEPFAAAAWLLGASAVAIVIGSTLAESGQDQMTVSATLAMVGSAPIIFLYTPIGTTPTLGRAITNLAILDRRKGGEGRASIEKFIDWRQDQWRRLARGAGAAAITTGATLLGLALADGAVSTTTTSSSSNELADEIVAALDLGDDQDAVAADIRKAIIDGADSLAADLVESVYDQLPTVDGRRPLDMSRDDFASLVDDSLAGGTTVERVVNRSDQADIEGVLAFSGVMLLVAAFGWFAALFTQANYINSLSTLGAVLGDPSDPPAGPIEIELRSSPGGFAVRQLP